MIQYDKKLVICIVLSSFAKYALGAICFFYPNYPSFDPVIGAHCPDICCTGYVKNASYLCCTSSSNTSSTTYWWIIFPVIACFLIILTFVLNRICVRIKLKNRIRNATRMQPRGTSQTNAFQQQQAVNDYYGSAIYDTRIYDIQSRLPTYHELFSTNSDNNLGSLSNQSRKSVTTNVIAVKSSTDSTTVPLTYPDTTITTFDLTTRY